MPFLLFILGIFVYIYLELSLLVSVGSSIGIFPLIILMIAISALGIWLVKLRGALALFEIRQQIAQGKMPTEAVISSVFFAISGIFLLIPGFLSDILALLLLLPPVRLFIQAFLLQKIAQKVHFRGFSHFGSNQHRTADETVFDAEFEREQDEHSRLK